MARKFASLADKYRRHRKVFELALELGITPSAAETRLTVMEIRERQRAREHSRSGARADRAAQVEARRRSAQPREFERFDNPWMMRD